MKAALASPLAALLVFLTGVLYGSAQLGTYLGTRI